MEHPKITLALTILAVVVWVVAAIELKAVFS